MCSSDSDPPSVFVRYHFIKIISSVGNFLIFDLCSDGEVPDR